MEDLKSLTVKYLRDLARKHLGKGHSKLKTREELIAALKEFLPASLRTASAAATVAVAEKAAAAVVPHDAAGAKAEMPEEAESITAEPAEQHDAEPLVEGFFVARVQGEEEARRHHMTEASNRTAVETKSKPVYEEHLGELPHTYGDDSALALPKDPTTVFFFWDFKAQTQAGAFEGLRDPHALLKIFDGDTLVREVDFALESKSFYVHGLTPGRRYRLEAHAVGRDGESRRIGRSTNSVMLPREGPSTDTSVRFLRAPWTLPVGRMVEAIRAGDAQVRESVGEREYLDMEEWEELANSATHIGRRVVSRKEPIPGRGPSELTSRRRHMGASEKHQGAGSSWPSGRK